MRIRLLLMTALLGLTGLMISQEAWAQAADNTRWNKDEMSMNAVTAEKQGQGKSDRDITREIRQAIMKDHALSSYAHNVKIITKDGVVTLKGPVHNAQEKKNIEDKAAAVAGMGHVKSEISVMKK